MVSLQGNFTYEIQLVETKPGIICPKGSEILIAKGSYLKLHTVVLRLKMAGIKRADIVFRIEPKFLSCREPLELDTFCCPCGVPFIGWSCQANVQPFSL